MKRNPSTRFSLTALLMLGISLSGSWTLGAVPAATRSFVAESAARGIELLDTATARRPGYSTAPVSLQALANHAKQEPALAIDFRVTTYVHNSWRDRVSSDAPVEERAFFDASGSLSLDNFIRSAVSDFSYARRGQSEAVWMLPDALEADFSALLTTDGINSIVWRRHGIGRGNATISQFDARDFESIAPVRWLNLARYYRLDSADLVVRRAARLTASAQADEFIAIDRSLPNGIEIRLSAVREFPGQIQRAEFVHAGKVLFRVENSQFAKLGSGWIPTRVRVEQPGSLIQEIEVLRAAAEYGRDELDLYPAMEPGTWIVDDVAGARYKLFSSRGETVLSPAIGPFAVFGAKPDLSKAVAGCSNQPYN